MLNVGIIGLDTSHPAKFADILVERPDTTVAAIWDGGDVRDETYAEAFCKEYGAVRCDSPRRMVDIVDAAMILTVNWETHCQLSMPFLEAGVPVLIDKPIAGTLSDVQTISAAASDADTPIFGGSAVPFHPATAALQETASSDCELTLHAGGYNDPFYYGVHLVDTIRRVIAQNWIRVEPDNGPGQGIRVHFEGGSYATLRLDGASEDAAFGFLAVGKRTRTAQVDSTVDELERMYAPYMEAFLETARRERDDREILFDAAILLLAVQAALTENVVVRPADESIETVDEDGASFLTEYEPYY